MERRECGRQRQDVPFELRRPQHDVVQEAQPIARQLIARKYASPMLLAITDCAASDSSIASNRCAACS